MRRTWILVANGGKALIFTADEASVLHEQHVLEHAESHLSRRDLVSDKKGRTWFHGKGTDSMEEPTPVKVKEATHFAHEIAHFLDKNYQAGEFERLYLIVKPPFLGFLRQSLSPHVAKVVESEIHKDLTLLQPEQIREYLPPIL
jgi:protein required for attachment to host cells